MTDSAKKSAHADSTLDLRLGEVLDEYLQHVEKGTAIPRAEFLEKHPEMADRLAACLDGIELFGEPDKPQVIEDSKPALPEIADYEIHGEIGRGGMGVVYEAREKSLDRTVALKVMRFGIVDPRALERFRREAETAGALHHTNIVPVYATGREGDTSWYAMQLIEGQSLAQRIHSAYADGHRKPVSSDEIIDVGLQAAEALHHAHERDVVHRDVKPANLIVDKEGRVWLTDFGLARRLVDVGATMTGALLGTPRYMSPEQADLSRVDVDHRSDIYSLGATLYELATGTPPFAGDDPLSVISQIRFEEPPSPRSIRPGISRDLDVVLMKCLAKESSRRYATAEELADDLRAIRDDRPIKAKPTSFLEHTARWVRKHQVGARTAGVAAIATLLIGVLAMLGWENWREYNQAAFRLRAAGGPYSTTIQPVQASNAATSSSVEPMNLTVPMQSYQKLPHGDYDVMLSSRGRWSQKVRLPIRPGLDTEYSLRAQDRPVREISIDGAMAAVTAAFDGPAILWSRDGQLRRYATDEKNDWTMDASKIETQVVRISPADDTETESDADSSDDSLEVDFAVFPPVDRTPWVRSRWHENPQIATPARTLRSAIDIDADGTADTIVAAMGKSALMAVNANGKILWSKAYDLNGHLREGNPSTLRGPIQHLLPGIIDMHDVGDRDDDGVSDLVAQMVHIQPGIQNDVCLVLLSGRSGDVINAVHPPAVKLKDYSDWPFDGQLRYYYMTQRTTGTMRFYEHRFSIDGSYDHRKVVRRTGGTSTFAVPSPLMLMDAATGDELWDLKEPQVSGQHRLALTADIDNDGTRDFVAASVHGSTPLQLKPGDSTEIGIASVYVDWISGVIGQSIMWASHPITKVPQEIGRADIDAIRCTLNGLDPKLVEVDFVSGGNKEVELDSMTIQFHPSSHEPVSVASGLTHCASLAGPNPNSRLFYKRPGPLLDGEQTLVFLRDRQSDTIRVGESEVVAAWTTHSPDGSRQPTKLAGLKGLTAERFSVMNVEQQKTIWSTVASASDFPAFFPIQRQNGSFDFLASRPHYNSAPELLDGDTGKSVWTMSAEPGGKIIHAVSIKVTSQPERIFVVGDGQIYSINGDRPDSLRMSMIDPTNGRVLWYRHFLHGAARQNTPNHLDDIQFADVNDDGVLDVIGPEQLKDEKEVRIAVWDGIDGQVLWMTDPLKNGSDSDYLPGPFEFVRVAGRPRIAHVQKTPEDTFAKLVLRAASNGSVLTEAQLPDELAHLANNSERHRFDTYGAMADCSTQDDARLCLSSNSRQTLSSYVVTVRDEKLSFDTACTDESPHQNYRVWLKDVARNATVERIELKRDALICRDVQTNDLLWKIEFPKKYYRVLTFDQSNRTAWVHAPPGITQNTPSPPVRLVDLSRGKVIGEFEARRFVDGRMPSVLSGEDGISLIWPLNGGTRVKRLAPNDVTQDTPVGPTKADARRIGHWRIGQHGRSMQSIVFSGVRSALILCAFVLPFLYVGTMIVQRRWSLSFFLLAPLVLMLFLVVTRTSWFGIITLLDGYAWLATPLGFWLAIRPPMDPDGKAPIHVFGRDPRVKWSFLAVLMVIGFVAFLAQEYAVSNELLTYQISPRDILFGATATISYAFRYWFGFMILFIAFSKLQKLAGEKQPAVS